MYGSVIVTESKMGWGESRWEGERANGRWREPAGGGESRWEGVKGDMKMGPSGETKELDLKSI